MKFIKFLVGVIIAVGLCWGILVWISNWQPSTTHVTTLTGASQTSTKSASEMVSCLSEYLTCLAQITSAFDWAYPRFADVKDKWSASYKGEGTWLVKSYDIDGSYAGAWAVPEKTCRMIGYEKKRLDDFQEIKPFDEVAKSVVSRQKTIGKPPPLPTFAVRSQDFGKSMIQAAQLYIANMVYKEADENGFMEVQKAIRTFTPLDWRISYDSSTWVVATAYYEDKVVVWIDPRTNKITAYRMFR